MEFVSIDKLKLVLSMEKIEPTKLEVGLNDTSNVTPQINNTKYPPYDPDYTSEWQLCGFTLGQIIKATICGEAKGEIRRDPDAGNLVYATMMNRRLNGPAHLLGNESTLNRGAIYNGMDSHPMSRVMFSRFQYSIWNDKSIFESCESFKNKMNELMSGCLLNGPPCHVCGLNRLKDAGFTTQEASRTTHYINPRSSDSKERWVLDVISSWRKHPAACRSGQAWADQIRNRAGELVTAKLTCIGNHVFVSGLP